MIKENRNDPKYVKLPHGDGRCGARWRRQDETHCYTCHETYIDIEVYDSHMQDGICQGPTQTGLVLQGGQVYRAWGKPNPEELPLAWR